MNIDKNITWGSIVSWILIIISAAIVYGRNASATIQNTKDVLENRIYTQKVETLSRDSDKERLEQISQIRIDVATTKVTVIEMNKKLDSFIFQRKLALDE